MTDAIASDPSLIDVIPQFIHIILKYFPNKNNIHSKLELLLEHFDSKVADFKAASEIDDDDFMLFLGKSGMPLVKRNIIYKLN